jgi:hypothetical protein
MRQWICGIITCCLSLGLAAQVNRVTPNEKLEGFRSLFDGKSLRQWQDVRQMKPQGDGFSIEDGCIKVNGKPRFREDLFSKESFANFELRFDWKISAGGNSGLKYRVQEIAYLHPSFVPDNIKKFEHRVDHALSNPTGRRSTTPNDGQGELYSVAFEYQVIDNDAHADAKRSKKSWAGALYQLMEPEPGAWKAAGEWNEARVIVNGDQFEHWLNGKLVVKGRLDDPAVALGLAARWTEKSPVFQLLTKRPKAAGPIVIQNHNDEAWFRNIRIKRLP